MLASDETESIGRAGRYAPRPKRKRRRQQTKGEVVELNHTTSRYSDTILLSQSLLFPIYFEVARHLEGSVASSVVRVVQRSYRPYTVVTLAFHLLKEAQNAAIIPRIVSRQTFVASSPLVRRQGYSFAS